MPSPIRPLLPILATSVLPRSCTVKAIQEGLAVRVLLDRRDWCRGGSEGRRGPDPSLARLPGENAGITARLTTPGCGRADTGLVRITIWVRPGSSRPGVGGRHDGALVVRVSAAAVGGQATAAALAAVAAAFGVRRGAVTLVAGAASRTKIVDVPGADPAVLDHLLGPPAREG